MATKKETKTDAAKLNGKIVAPFCTHGGGGAGRFFTDVRKAFATAKTLDGLAIRCSNQIARRLGTGVTSHHTEDDVVEWLNMIFKQEENAGAIEETPENQRKAAYAKKSKNRIS